MNSHRYVFLSFHQRNGSTELISSSPVVHIMWILLRLVDYIDDILATNADSCSDFGTQDLK